ncbi:39S ribosomal protein L28, mitochondrial [Aphelenchoides besseyi]|nr:39S ribosomal protein L28, mitochondrial [Aphelenchoides besseyi]KAI6211779.1 39S ribosomal protein L28, mitochondrial [Aphelenchoides besseyi]
MSLMKNLKPLTKIAPRPVIAWDKHERIVRNQEIWANPNSIVHRLPFHYQQRYWRNVLSDAQPVHYEPPAQSLMWDTKRLIEVELEDYPIRPLPNVPEMQQGLWGGEGVVKGYRESAPFVKKKVLPRRWYPRWWFPEYYNAILYSEVLDQYLKITVTYRSQRLIDEAYGLDFYLLKTPEIDVNSKLGNRLKRAILVKLAQGNYYPDDEQKRCYIEQKYSQFVLPLEEAEWVGLDLNEACRKLQDIEDNTASKPEKYRYEEELLARLRSGEDSIDEAEEDSKPKYQKSAFAEKSTLGRMMQPVEQTMVKNFRVEFIERVCYFDPTAAVRLSSEVGRVLLEEKLSRGSDIDLPKLKSYAMRFVVPQRYRVRVWKLLLKISTCYPPISLSVSTNRFQEADRLWQTVRRMLSFQLDRYLPSIPNPQLIALTILFARTEVSILDLQQTRLCSPAEKALLMMTQQIHDLCKHTTAPVNWEDTFWLSCQIRDRLALHETVISSLVEEGLYIKQTLQDRLNQNNQSKRISESHGEAVSFDMNSMPESMSSSDFELSFLQNGTSTTCFDTVTAIHLEMWYRSGGSSWLKDEPLFMLWDKICSQEMAILYLKSVLFQLFTTIAMSSETHKRLPADDLINQALSTSMQMQVIKMGMDDVGRRSTAILNDVAFSMTY